MIKVNSRTCRVYAAMEGIRPSDVARLMLESAAEIGWWYEDQLPWIHMIEALMDAKDSQHLSHPITVEYGWCLFWVNMSARRQAPSSPILLIREISYVIR